MQANACCDLACACATAAQLSNEFMVSQKPGTSPSPMAFDREVFHFQMPRVPGKL